MASSDSQTQQQQQQQIILFDLASKDGNKCWSYNPWKTRLVLAHKSLPYTTEFLDYPQIKQRIGPHLPPSTIERYTIPTIQYTDGRYIIDSRVIAETIEKDFPSPPLYLDSPYLEKLQTKVLEPLMRALRPHFVAKVARNLIREASVEYFTTTREKVIGMSLDDFEKKEGQVDNFAEAEPYLHEITGWLKENEKGPYFMGKTVGYADFVWGGILLFFQRIDASGKEFDGLVKATGDEGVHRALLEALEPLSRRSDY